MNIAGISSSCGLLPYLRIWMLARVRWEKGQS